MEKYNDKQEAYALQMYNRHIMINKLLKDIIVDITVCNLEGWNYMEYPNMLKREIDRIINIYHKNHVHQCAAKQNDLFKNEML